MPTSSNNQNKLLPLRNFADEKLYTSAYLSQLVQRNRLKAEKIGRNYFTCEKWFREYLDKHASDDKRAIHEKLQKQQDKTSVKLNILVSAIVVMAVFVLLVFTALRSVNNSDQAGRVAGEFEANLATSSDINILEVSE